MLSWLPKNHLESLWKKVQDLARPAEPESLEEGLGCHFDPLSLSDSYLWSDLGVSDLIQPHSPHITKNKHKCEG